ncbi:hypothetical protein [Chryseobacterium sp. RR2-3-20]|uniref:hypothetical protein n=1 Tax=Chryseobacterium sp. RR2-3-20 TaxID=2787626 RepID=UPI001ADFFE3F|nr:hypothetical protein [Chryseobacterium sp. RR2-3-20]
MQFPFYCTFSEFEKNYIKIFKDWLESYPDGTEKDFAYEYKRNIYDRFFNFFGGNAHYGFGIPVKTVDENDNIDDFKLYHREYVRIVENRLRLFISISEPNRKQKFAKELVSSLKICDDEPYDKNLSFFKDGYILDYETLYIYQHLFSYDFTDYTKKWFLDIDENALKNFEFSIKRIYKFLEKKINVKNELSNDVINENQENNVSITFKKNDFTKENLIFNILLFFDLLKELTGFLSPITTEKDLEYVRKNKNKIFEIEEKLNKSDIKRYFMLFNQIQNRDDRLPFLKNVHSNLKELKMFWGLRYNDDVFAKAKDFNLFWNESEFRNTIYRATYNIKELDTFLSKLTTELEDSKSEPVDSKISIETPENDFSNNEDKEKLIILEKLKIIDYIKSIQTKPETISHTAEILSAITGINSTTLYTYLRPMLNANRDDADKNSPYKNNENILNANKIILKLKIKNTDANN